MKAERLDIAMLCVHSCPLGVLGTTFTGGMSVHILETAHELSRRGRRVDVFTRRHGQGHPDVVELGCGVRVVHVSAGDDGPLYKHHLLPHLDEFATNLEAFRQKDGRRYGLIHSHYWLSGCVGQKLRKAWNASHVMAFHTLGAAEQSHSPRPEEPEIRLTREGELAREADLIVSPTRREKREIVDYYGADPDRIAVVPCGVNLETFRPVDREQARARLGLENGEKIILYVGRIDPMKGVDRLVTALARIKQKMTCKLLVVGGEDAVRTGSNGLPALARRLGLGEAVIFAGCLPQEELRHYYTAADVFALPSHYESFGLAGLEALACGTPVVAADVGIYGQILDHGPGGRLAEDGRAEIMAAKIEEMLSVPSAPGQREQIRQTVLGYSWAASVDALEKEYRRLARTEPPGRPELEK